MNRNEFIETLTKKLRENNISDIDEIIAEYEEHFNFKLSDGYSEEEIAALLEILKKLLCNIHLAMLIIKPAAKSNNHNRACVC